MFSTNNVFGQASFTVCVDPSWTCEQIEMCVDLITCTDNINCTGCTTTQECSGQLPGNVMPIKYCYPDPPIYAEWVCNPHPRMVHIKYWNNCDANNPIYIEKNTPECEIGESLVPNLDMPAHLWIFFKRTGSNTWFVSRNP